MFQKVYGSCTLTTCLVQTEPPMIKFYYTHSKAENQLRHHLKLKIPFKNTKVSPKGSEDCTLQSRAGHGDYHTTS